MTFRTCVLDAVLSQFNFKLQAASTKLELTGTIKSMTTERGDYNRRSACVPCHGAGILRADLRRICSQLRPRNLDMGRRVVRHVMAPTRPHARTGCRSSTICGFSIS